MDAFSWRDPYSATPPVYYIQAPDGYWYSSEEVMLLGGEVIPRSRHSPTRYVLDQTTGRYYIAGGAGGSELVQQIAHTPDTTQVSDPLDFTDRLKYLIMTTSRRGRVEGKPLSELKDFEGSEVWFGYPAPTEILNFYFVQYDNSPEVQGYIILQKKDTIFKKYFIRDDPLIKWGFVDPRAVNYEVNKPYIIDGQGPLYYQGIAYMPQSEFSSKRRFTYDEFNNNFHRLFFDEDTGTQREYPKDIAVPVQPFNAAKKKANNNAAAERRRIALEEEQLAAALRQSATEEEERLAFDARRIDAAKKKANNNAAATEALRRQLESELAAELAAQRRAANETRRKREARQKLLAKRETARLAAKKTVRWPNEAGTGPISNTRYVPKIRNIEQEFNNANAAVAVAARRAEISRIRNNVAGRLVNQNRSRALNVNATRRRTERNQGLRAIAAAVAQQRAYNEAVAQPPNSTVSSLLAPGHLGLLNRFTPRQPYPSVIGRHSTIKNLMNRSAADKAIANATAAKEAAHEDGSPVSKTFTPNSLSNAAGTGLTVNPMRAPAAAASAPRLLINPSAYDTYARKPLAAAADPRSAFGSTKPRTTQTKKKNKGSNGNGNGNSNGNSNNKRKLIFNPMLARGTKKSGK